MTSTFDLSGWRTTTATVLTETLPLQTFDTALILVESYLSSVGGWVPDSPSNPTGPGVPKSGETPAEAALSIKAQQFQRIYSLNLLVNIQVQMGLVVNFQPGQADSVVLDAVQSTIEQFLIKQLQNSNLELNSVDSYIGTVFNGGATTAQQRVGYLAALQENPLIPDTEDLSGATPGPNALDIDMVDPCAIALRSAVLTYSLDSTWNIDSYYTDTSNILVVVIKKYSDVTFAALDLTATTQYVISINQSTYEMESGLAIPVS